ncbi:MAG: hypothetical protein PVH87_13075 [Desulfobacteraceae bacterium]|jgi:hypothetical protein
MDDFLHNLRSGKLKQQDRTRSYSDPQYKGGQRRNVMDRRKKELEAFERLTAVKEVLEAISQTQKRMADAYEARTHAENRKARALEVLAQNIYRMLNPDARNVEDLFAPEPASEAVAPADAMTTVDDPSSETAKADSAFESPRKLSDEERQSIFELIRQMRKDGSKWEQIARHIASKGYPTVSGKGTWRGVMAKNIYEKMASK